MKIGVITPYYKESRETIERCIDSVKQQTIKSDHFLISDGYPHFFLDSIGVRHIKLDISHGDYGCTPRGIGAQLAISEGYCGVALLDADNWYDSDHVEVCIEAAKSLTGNYIDCDYVIARRRLISPDLKFDKIISEGRSVDTNLYFFCPGSYFMVPYWNLMPKEVSMTGAGDNIFAAHLSEKNLVFAKTRKLPSTTSLGRPTGISALGCRSQKMPDRRQITKRWSTGILVRSHARRRSCVVSWG